MNTDTAILTEAILKVSYSSESVTGQLEDGKTFTVRPASAGEEFILVDSASPVKSAVIHAGQLLTDAGVTQ